MPLGLSPLRRKPTDLEFSEVVLEVLTSAPYRNNRFLWGLAWFANSFPNGFRTLGIGKPKDFFRVPQKSPLDLHINVCQ